MEEPQQHIHDRLCSELNEMSIRIKLHYMVPAETRKKLANDGKMPAEPTWHEINELIEQCRDEMNQCTKPFKLHR
jgi:hypothetical protein